MTDKVEPAITPEEWWHIQHGYPWNAPDEQAPSDRAAQFASDWAQEGKLHKAAAAALHGRDFGFTRRDVRFLRDFVGSYENEWREGEWGGETAHLRSILARIAALLPELE